MAIVPMRRVRLIAPAAEQDRLLDALQRAGCVQLRLPEEAEDRTWDGLLERCAGDLEEVRAEREEVCRALTALDRWAPARRPLLAPKREVTEAELFAPRLRARARETAAAVNRAAGEAAAAEEEKGYLLARRAALLPWREMELPLERQGTAHTVWLTGTLRSGVSLEEIREQLAETAPLSDLKEVGRDRGQRCLLLLAHREDAPAAQEVLRAWGFTPARFPGLTGTARANLERLDREIAAETARGAEAAAAVATQAGGRETLRLSLDRLAQEEQREEERARLLHTERTILLEGWVSGPEEQELLAVLARFPCAWELTDPDPEEYGEVPVRLRNNPLSRPLNVVTEMYALPRYGTVDPNPLMAPFFVLFYGMMMADMAYGLLMAGAWLVIRFRMRAGGSLGNFGDLLGLCGGSTFLFGALTGSFLGDFLPQLAALLYPGTSFAVLPALFTPLDDTLAILLGALALGLAQTLTGMAVNVAKKCRSGDALGALLDEGAWWVILAGAALLPLAGRTAGVTALLTGAGMLVAGQARARRSVAGTLGGLAGAVYRGVTGLFGDVLSYSRLMALMLSGAIIATVFNTLGAVPGNVAAFLVISLLGNALNFALNLLGCFVHDLRLQCLEFFGRFYEPGGRPFQPLCIRTRYTELVKEEH